MRIVPASIRMQLAATAVAGLSLVALMTVFVLKTTSASQNVVNQARASQERVRAFTHLYSSVHLLQTLTYQSVRENTPEHLQALRTARAEFVGALNTAANLQHRDSQEALSSNQLLQAGERVLSLFDQGQGIVDAVNEQWRLNGSNAALKKVQSISEPFIEFVKIVESEISRRDNELAYATDRAFALQRAVRVVALAALALGLAISIIVFLVLLTRVGPALKILQEGTRFFGAGDFAHRVPLTGDDELAQLASSFNAMAQELAEKQRALQGVQAGLEQAVARRTAELEQANWALSAEDGRRRAFLADVSHEFRIPLTIIRGEAQVALRTAERGTVDSTEVFSQILEQTRYLSRLLDDLFLIARAEAGGLALNVGDVDIVDLITRVAQDFSTIACESGATVRATADVIIRARGDAHRIRQALAALIDNALRHTRPGVNIEIRAESAGNFVSLSVSDDGPGFDRDVLADLFGRFKRGSTRGEGSGLGLTVVRALAEAHGGTARLFNGADGGATAVLLLPQEPSLPIRAVA